MIIFMLVMILSACDNSATNVDEEAQELNPFNDVF